MRNPKDWNIEFHDKGLGAGYTATVEHPKDHEPRMMTSDGTVVRIHYTALKGASKGEITWDIGIMNDGGLPPRNVVVAVVAGDSVMAVVPGMIRGSKVNVKKTKKRSAKR